MSKKSIRWHGSTALNRKLNLQLKWFRQQGDTEIPAWSKLNKTDKVAVLVGAIDRYNQRTIDGEMNSQHSEPGMSGFQTAMDADSDEDGDDLDHGE